MREIAYKPGQFLRLLGSNSKRLFIYLRTNRVEPPWTSIDVYEIYNRNGKYIGSRYFGINADDFVPVSFQNGDDNETK